MQLTVGCGTWPGTVNNRHMIFFWPKFATRFQFSTKNLFLQQKAGVTFCKGKISDRIFTRFLKIFTSDPELVAQMHREVIKLLTFIFKCQFFVHNSPFFRNTSCVPEKLQFVLFLNVNFCGLRLCEMIGKCVKLVEKGGLCNIKGDQWGIRMIVVSSSSTSSLSSSSLSPPLSYYHNNI